MRARRSRDAPDDEQGEDDEEPSPRARPRRSRSGRGPVRSWSASAGDEDEEADEEGGGLFHRRHERVYFRARDSFYFEPLVALAIILLLLVSLWAFTQNWPPVYVVESNSMQHGGTDQLGLINTGDLVLAQRIASSQVTTYIAGSENGYSTYGEYGDVLLYNPRGVAGTPIIHRALIFLDWNPNGSFDAPSLAGLPCGSSAGAVYDVSSSPSGCGTVGLTGVLTLHNIGWQSASVAIPLGSIGHASGYVTMGDNNFDSSTTPVSGITDQTAHLSDLVQPGWIVGAARGMVPWFGSVKLLLQGNAQEVPSQSWEFLGLTLVGLVLAAMGLHYVLRAEGVEDPRRKLEDEEEAEEEGEEDDDEDAETPSDRHRWLHPIRTWRERGDEEEEEPSSETHAGSASSRRHDAAPRGRPRPSVGRRAAARARRKRPRRDDPDDDDA